LVNSRRFVGSQSPTGGAGSGLAVDLNNIPSALIERVEILPVGGAAVYGADAIAGVVNFILKDDYEGAELTVNHYDYAGMDEDSSFNFTIGGNFADGRGNIVLNAQVEDRGQVFYDQANDRIRNCTNGFLYENPQDSGQDIYGNVGYTYEQELSSGWDVNGLADAQGRRSFGDNGLHICPTLVSNPNEGLPTP
jgi:outer membrane receptor protein involved in Fe transport